MIAIIVHIYCVLTVFKLSVLMQQPYEVGPSITSIL